MDIAGVHTNIVMVKVTRSGLSAKQVCERLDTVSTSLGKFLLLNMDISTRPVTGYTCTFFIFWKKKSVFQVNYICIYMIYINNIRNPKM